MALIATQQIDADGVIAAEAAAAASQSFIPTNGTVLVIDNASAGAETLTLTTPKTVGGLAVAELVINIGAGELVVAGPFPPTLFADPADGECDLTWSATASITISVLKLF